MKSREIFPFIISFVWFGFVAAISFFEAPIKFTAPSLTLQVGLDVGRHIFAALNKVEIFFALLSILLIVLNKPGLKIRISFSVIIFILILQTVWLLPALETRAMIYINGGIPEDSSIHIIYIILEVIKLVMLFAAGIFQVNSLKQKVLKEINTFKEKNININKNFYETA